MNNKTNYMAKIAINKSLLKEYSNNEYLRIVYMKHGQEFQIQLFNPHKFTVGVEVFINEVELGNTLILRPGERVWLERFFDSPRKFLFSTYFVSGKNKEVNEAIADNGVVTLKFFKERSYYNNIDWLKNIDTSRWVYSGYDYNYPGSYTITSNGNINGVYNCSLSFNTSGIYPKYSAASTTAASTIIDNDGSVNMHEYIKYNDNKVLKETGRIEKGDYSNQKFNTSNVELELIPFSIEHIQILPESQKQVNANDLKKIYCHECGRKIKDKFKFCPFCGTKL